MNKQIFARIMGTLLLTFAIIIELVALKIGVLNFFCYCSINGVKYSVTNCSMGK